MFGVLTTSELKQLGMTRGDQAQAAQCCLHKIRRGHFVLLKSCTEHHHVALAPISGSKETSFPVFHNDFRDGAEMLRLQIASRRDVLLPGDVFSHVSAALIHQLDPAVSVSGKVEISRTSSRNYRDLTAYSRKLLPSDIAESLAYPVTTLERTLTDIALDHPLEVSVPLISQAMRKHGFTKDCWSLDGRKGVRGLTQALQALSLSSAIFEAPSEALCAVKFFRFGITGMVPQVDVLSPTGGVMARTDFQHETLPVVVEVHGIGKNYLSPKGPDQASKDNNQRNMALLNAGFMVFNLTFRDLFRPHIFVQIKQCIAKLEAERRSRPRLLR